MITILSRPIGYTLPTTSVQGAVTRDVADGGKVLVTSIAHGLVESQVIYIKSNIEDYNGFYQINYRTIDTFRIYKTAITKMVWVQDVPITFFVTTGQCNWSCVHLPITYKLLSNKYPTNYLDPAVTISGYVNDSGYVNLTLSTPLAGSVNDLDYIKITGSTSPNIDGVYQIMEANSTSNITISLVFDSYVFGSANVNRWYNNYHIVINVYAGLNSSHFFASKKPYELAGTLRIIPSTDPSLTGASLGDNAAFFSVNEILKSYVKTNNNLLLGTLPNNLDAFTEFYIETYESYDVGTGYSFLNFESAHVSDQSNFEGFAVNAKLPFKNIQSGYLSDYLMNNATAKFLTLFAIPVMFAGCADKDDCYFDVSFINPLPYNVNTLLYLSQVYYKNGTNPYHILPPYKWLDIPTFSNFDIKGSSSFTISSIPSLTPYAAQQATDLSYSDAINISINCSINITGAFTGNVRVLGYVYDTIGIIGGTALATSNPIDITTSGITTFTLPITVSTGAGIGNRGKFIVIEIIGIPISSGSPKVELTIAVDSIKYKLISNFDNGIYRAQPDKPSCENDRVDLSIVKTIQFVNENFIGSLSPWVNDNVGYGTINWTYGSNSAIGSFAGGTGSTHLLMQAFQAQVNNIYAFNYTLSVASYASGTLVVQVWLIDPTGAIQAHSVQVDISGNGAHNGTITVSVSSSSVANAITLAGILVNSSTIGPVVTLTQFSSISLNTISETKQVTINCDCNNQNIRLMWLNYLGGYDSWLFTTLKDYLIDIPGTTETKQNIFPDWPKSYGANADTIRKQVSRESINQIAIHSQNVNEDELQAIEYIKTSPLVQIVKSRTDRRTVIVDKNSFKVYTDSDKLHTIDMVLTFTDDIPSQSV